MELETTGSFGLEDTKVKPGAGEIFALIVLEVDPGTIFSFRRCVPCYIVRAWKIRAPVNFLKSMGGKRQLESYDSNMRCLN